MLEIVIYTRQAYPYCHHAKQLLKAKGHAFQERDIGDDVALARRLVAETGRRSVPQVFVGPHALGGYTELMQKMASGEFAALLNAS